MRHVAAVVALLFQTALAIERADAQSNPYALDRLFLILGNNVPFNEVLPFNSVTAVENYFGINSSEAQLANDFFAGYSGSSAKMLFDRIPAGGGRARLYGADISTLTLPQVRKISGTLSVTSQGYTFNAQINLSSATSLKSAAGLIQSQLDAAQPTVATTLGSSIARGSASFTGSILGGFMRVTAVSGGPIVVGGHIGSPNGYLGHIVAQINGTPGGVGLYSVFYAPSGVNHVIVPAGTTLSETYGTLTIGTVTSGTVAIGQEVTGGGVLGNTAIQANIKGSGNGSTWVVDLPQTTAPTALQLKAAPLNVGYHSVTGHTADSGSIWISQNEFYRWASSSMTYASGTVADELGLTAHAGAYLSTPGQDFTDPSAWMNNIVQNETDAFASFQLAYVPRADKPPYVQNALEAWAASNGYRYLQAWSANTPPIVNSIPTMSPIPTIGVTAPEPSSWFMLLLGFAGLGLVRWSRSWRTPAGKRHLRLLAW